MSELPGTSEAPRGFRRERLLTPLGAIVAAGLIFLLVITVRQRGWLFTPEARLLDAMLLHHSAKSGEASVCAIVCISERDIRDVMGQYPISDELLAELIERIASFKPRAIGLDLFRDVPVPVMPSSTTQPVVSRPSTAPARSLEEVIKSTREVVGIYFIDPNAEDTNEDWVAPPPALVGTQRAGFNNVPEDADGRVRRLSILRDDPDNLMRREQLDASGAAVSEPSFALRLALRYLRPEKITLTPVEGLPAIQLGRARIDPISSTLGAYVPGLGAGVPAGYEFVMDWRVRPPEVKHELVDVLSDGFDGSVLYDKVVLFGVDATSIKDYLPTPRDAYMPGVVLQAAFVDQLVRAARTGRVGVRSWGDSAEHAWIGAWCVVGGLIGLALRPIASYAPRSAGGVAALGVTAALAIVTLFCNAAAERGLWLPLLPSALGVVGSAALATAWVSGRESADRRAWAALTGKLVSPQIATELWQSRTDLIDHGRMKPRRMTATVLFFDLKGFTAMAERVSPEEMVGLLNELFQEMTTTIEKHRGVVNKFVGDQIMALFGPPFVRTIESHHREDAQNAVRCACDLRAALVHINESWRGKNRPELSMRVGIFTGPLVAGSVGSRERLEYTVIGPTVNTASRLESVAKELFDASIAPGHCRILIGQPTRDLLGEGFTLQPVDVGEMTGISQSFKVYAVL